MKKYSERQKAMRDAGNGAFPVNFIARVFRRITGLGSVRWPFIKYNSFIALHYKNLKSFNPDVIYAHDISALPVSGKVAEELGCKLIFDSHELETHRNPPLTKLQRRMVRHVERKYLPKCDYVTTVCESLENILRTEYKLDKTGLVFNAPALKGGTSHPRWARRAAGDIRTDAGLAPDDYALLYVGLITVNRGIEFVLDSIEHLPEQIKLVALGPGSQTFKDELKIYANKLGLEERFIILDPVNPPDVYRYIRRIDASIIPVLPATLSYEIALPNKFFESAFAGIPIICADLVEMKKMIEQYRLGITYDALDKHDCANAIREVYYNKRQYQPRREDTEAFQNWFSWENQEAFLLSVLNEVTSREPDENGK